MTRRQLLARVTGPIGVIAMAVALTASIGFAATLGVTSHHLTILGTEIEGDQICTLTAVADSYADEFNSTSNFGTDSELTVRSHRTGGNLRNAETFVRFNISSCLIPGDADVISADLTLVMHGLSLAGDDERIYEARRITADWTESGTGSLTWSDRPDVATSASSSTGTGTVTGSGLSIPLSWDVGSDVLAVIAGADDFGWRVKDTVDTTSNTRNNQLQEALFRSREYGTTAEEIANRPTLTITYTLP